MVQDLDALLDRRGLKRRVTLWRVAAIVFAGLVLVLVFGQSRGVTGAHVARLTVSGVIVDDFKRDALIQEIADSKDAKALIVRINSPGGTVGGSEALYDGLRAVGKNKPVVAVMSTLAASGGYVTAIAGDYIVARQNALTGSIGVIFRYPDVSKLAGEVGIGINEIKSAPLKSGPSPFEPMSDEMRASIQSIVDDSYDWFVGLVAERRSMSREDALIVADGRVYTGRQAHARGLVDALGGEDVALAWLESEKDVSASLPVVDYRVSPYKGLVPDFMSSLFGQFLGGERLTLDGLLALWHP